MLIKENGMRNFYYRFIKNIFVIYVCMVMLLSYRLVYNEFYFEINDEIEVSYTEEKRVYPMGKIVGLYTKCNGVFVIDTCEIESFNGQSIDIAGEALRKGDYIISINGKTINEKEDMVEMVKQAKGQALDFSVLRDEELFNISLTPVLAQNGTYMLGVWVKDDLAGVGTITYFTETGDFAALGHGMGDGETQNLVEIDGGDIYVSNVIGIEKGVRGNPGEIKSVICYGATNHMGKVYANTGKGIYGVFDQEKTYTYTNQYKSYAIAEKQHIEQGPAQIISEISGVLRSYDIVITYVDYLATDTNKGLHIKVTDPELIELTGGIVQGMSGSPIIQNGKLIGAVTHVLINDPEQGYGIFIDEMMK